MLKKFKERSTFVKSPEYVLDYAFVHVKNIHDDDEPDGKESVCCCRDSIRFTCVDGVCMLTLRCDVPHEHACRRNPRAHERMATRYTRTRRWFAAAVFEIEWV